MKAIPHMEENSEDNTMDKRKRTKEQAMPT